HRFPRGRRRSARGGHGGLRLERGGDAVSPACEGRGESLCLRAALPGPGGSPGGGGRKARRCCRDSCRPHTSAGRRRHPSPPPASGIPVARAPPAPSDPATAPPAFSAIPSQVSSATTVIALAWFSCPGQSNFIRKRRIGNGRSFSPPRPARRNMGLSHRSRHVASRPTTPYRYSSLFLRPDLSLPAVGLA